MNDSFVISIKKTPDSIRKHYTGEYVEIIKKFKDEAWIDEIDTYQFSAFITLDMNGCFDPMVSVNFGNLRLPFYYDNAVNEVSKEMLRLYGKKKERIIDKIKKFFSSGNESSEMASACCMAEGVIDAFSKPEVLKRED